MTPQVEGQIPEDFCTEWLQAKRELLLEQLNSGAPSKPLLEQLNDLALSPRPNRKQVAHHKIAAYWAKHPGKWFPRAAEDPQCFKCGLKVQEWRGLERAHIVDRCKNGLDHEGNLALLCSPCHYRMPTFYGALCWDAILWIMQPPSEETHPFLDYTSGRPVYKMTYDERVQAATEMLGYTPNLPTFNFP